jgi:cell wall assembly regulator SMI1
MISLLESVKSAQNRLKSIFEVECCELALLPPVTEADLSCIETDLRLRLPEDLRSIFINETGGLVFKWSLSHLIFGPEIKFGALHLLSPEQIVSVSSDLHSIVKDTIEEGLAEKVGYDALVKDWPFWLPAFRFSNGDYFCINTRRGHGHFSVVFLEHEVMDGGPNLHGLQIAPSIEDLLKLWSSVLFAYVHDWTHVVDDNGLNPQSPVFDQLRAKINREGVL